MKRRQLFEFHELDVFPGQWRDFCTDVLSYLAGSTKVYQVVAERLWKALIRSRVDRVLDLCSGGAVPINTIRQKWGEKSRNVPICVSDKYPNDSAFRLLEQSSDGGITAVYSSVDAMTVPPGLSGFRTLFTSFHHFNNEQGKRILMDAIRSNQGIGIFEYTERNFLVWIPVLSLMPLYIFCITPFLRPFSWKRLVWTYLIPIVPLALTWDGFVSCFRTYSPPELDNMVKQLPAHRYDWEIGQSRWLHFFKVTYLIGFPADRTDDEVNDISAAQSFQQR